MKTPTHRMTMVLLLLFPIVFGTFANESEKVEFVVSYSPATVRYNPIHTYTTTEAQIYTALYEGLVTYNPVTLEPIPAVAGSWDISENGTLYRFYIRENARYWNGDRVTADHFRDTWLKLLAPETEAEYASLLDIIKNAKKYRKGVITDPDKVGITVRGERILEVTLKHPATHFLKVLCHHSFVPIHPEMLDHTDWTQFASILSNGPFYIVKKTDSKMTLHKNQLYWDRKNVDVDLLRIEFIDDPLETVQRYNMGQIDWATADFFQHFDKLLTPDDLVVNPLFATNYFFFSCDTEPWSDPKVRNGLALLFPWQEIRKDRYFPTSAIVPAIRHYPEVSGIESQNIEKGLNLLQEAGYPNGKGLPPVKIAVPTGGESVRIAGLMKQAILQHTEMDVEISTHEYPGYFDYLQNKDSDYTLGTITWIGDFPDPLTFLSMWEDDSNLNDAGFSDETYNSLLRESMSQSGLKRYKTLSEAEKLLLEKAAVLPISNSPSFQLINLRRWKGWIPNQLDIHPFKYLKYSPFEPIPNVASFKMPLQKNRR